MTQTHTLRKFQDVYWEGHGEAQTRAPPFPLSQTGQLKKGTKLCRITCHHYHEACWCCGDPRGCPAPPDFRGRLVLPCGGQWSKLSRLSHPLSPGIYWCRPYQLGSTCLCVPDCGICPAIKEDVRLFLNGTSEEYVEYVKQYKDDPEILENTEKIKQCVGSTLTKEDKIHATTFIVSIYVSG